MRGFAGHDNARVHARTHLRRRSVAHPDPTGYAVRPMLTQADHVLCANTDAKMYACLYKLAGVSCIAMQDQYYGGFDSGRYLLGFWWFLCRAGPPASFWGLLCPLGYSVGGYHALLAGWVVPVLSAFVGAPHSPPPPKYSGHASPYLPWLLACPWRLSLPEALLTPHQ